MKPHRNPRFIPYLLVAGAIVSFAIQPATAQGNSKSAEQAWNELEILLAQKPAGTIRSGSVESLSARRAKIAIQAAHFRDVADAARDFYSRNATHPKAAEAKKIEAVNSIRAVTDGNALEERHALAVATEYRDDKSHSNVDRAEVALALERFRLSLRLKAKSTADSTSEWLKLADDLQKEFGDYPALQSYYVEIARRTDAATAAQIAAKVVRSSATPPAVRAEAQAMQDRAGMVGQPLRLKVATFSGGEIDLARMQNKIVAVVVWSPSDPESVASLATMRHGIPAGVEVIYVALGGTPDQQLRARSVAPTAGSLCYISPGGQGKAAANALKLKYAPAPYVYVLNRAGNVSGVGRLAELHALLVKALG